ncbi:MAG TPA: tetratricopeptide repeat protein [Thermoanaerobaculia bacterium]|jgi:tetratricopeptide (TPR) repeat protein
MNYPGNPSLSAAVKDRVVSTFRQAVTLYQQGRIDEVVAGCNLILQMDPTFDPGRKLLEKTKNPASAIDVNNLLPADDRSLEEARNAMVARDFERVVQITTEILTDDLMNDEARILGDEARERMEASPFVEQFARKCEQQISAGNLTAAKADLEKARALDPTHPAVVRIAQAIASRDAQPAPARPAFDATPSFIVDDAAQQATGRGTAAASDFGFTFEEEKPAAPPAFAPPAPAAPVTSFEGFSFDSPSAGSSPGGFGGFSFDSPTPAPPPPAAAGSFSFDAPSSAPTPAPMAGDFDFATASISTSPDDQKKIEQYLTDGDRALNAGDYQQAIDLWSRIFLIDVTNDQASERIERAKAKRRELEQRTEPLLSAGAAAFDRKDYDRARAEFRKVLDLDPANGSARDYLERIDDVANVPQPTAYEPPPVDNLDVDFFGDEPSGSYEAPLIPPDDEEEAPAAAARGSKKSGATKAAASGRKLPVGLIAAVLAVIVLGAGGWWAFNRFSAEPEADPAATQAIITRAESLAGRGRYEQAIGLLQDIKPGDPMHDRALSMIADLQQKMSSSAQMIGGIPAAQFYDQKIAAARAAVEAHDYSAAKRAFEEAMQVKPLPPDLKPLYDAATQQVAKLGAARTLFTEQRYADAITSLQPLLEQDPQNQNIRRMIVDAHFNMGAIALQNEQIPDAIREFDEVLKADPNDELARRSRELAMRYDGQPRDLLYRIYVKYLPLRTPPA